MIRTHRSTAGTSLALVGEHSRAFVDSDWVGVGDPVPALLVDSEGALWWDGERLATNQDDPQKFVEELLRAQADAIAATVTQAQPSRVWVIGGGVLADEVRRLLGQTERIGGDERPSAAVDLTGDALQRACQAVADGGTVVLAGERRERCDVDLYRDVHRRGLSLVGVRGLRTRAGSVRGNGRRLPDPMTLSAGEPLRPAPWYRLLNT